MHKKAINKQINEIIVVQCTTNAYNYTCVHFNNIKNLAAKC